MSSGMFNSEQEAHMRELAAIPPERRCWCGWYAKVQCHSCPPDKSRADQMASRCLECGADPGATNRSPTTHRATCSRQGLPHLATRKAGASDKGESNAANS